MSDTQTQHNLPGWWIREKQRRQAWFLIFLSLVLVLIGFYYWRSSYGLVGNQAGINFDTTNYLAFLHQDEKGNMSVYAVRADGSDRRLLTPKDDASNKQDPSWATDGKNILYSSNNNAGQVMQLYLLGDGVPKQFSYGAGNKFQPVASSDSKRIAFLTQGAVKTVLLNGEDVSQIMPPPHAGHADESEAEAAKGMDTKGAFLSAAFSPDGNRIAAVQTASSEENVYAEGGFMGGDQLVRVLLNEERAEILDWGREASFSWDPKGTRLATAFSEFHVPAKEKKGPLLKVDTLSGIRIWTFAGKPEARLIFGAFNHTVEPKNVAWSPEGDKIAFECWRKLPNGERKPMGLLVMKVPEEGAIQIQSEKDIKELQLMVPATGEGSPQSPRWSSDGARFVYEWVKTKGGRDIYVANTDGTNVRNLTQDLGGDNSQAQWAPKRK